MSDKYTNDGGPAFPLKEPVTSDALGMSLRQYAAIHLRVPDSGVDWLDEMIRKAQRDYFAEKAMVALIAEPVNEGQTISAWHWTNELRTHTQMNGPDIIAHAAYIVADAMLKAQEVNVATPLELQLQEQLAESKHVIVIQAAEIKALREEVSELHAARIAYASEFPEAEDGGPDTGNIHANIRSLKARAERLAEAIVRADLQIGDGHIEAARITLHDAMDAALSPPEQPAALSKENRND